MTLRFYTITTYFLFFIVFCLAAQIVSGQEASFPLPQTIKDAERALNWDGWFTIVVFILTFLGLIAEIRPPDITMLAGTGTLLIFGVLTPSQFLQGFSNEILMTIAMLCVIVRAMEVNGILEIIAKKILISSKYFIVQMASLCIPVSVASAFLNNTPIVLLMTPMVRKWALKNKNSPSKFLIPLSYASLLGGACTLIGTSTNLVVHGLMKEQFEGAGFSFFELSYVGVPCALAGLLFLLLFSRFLLPDRLDPASAVSEEAREFTGEFIVGEQCPLVNRTIKEAGRRYFRQKTLIQVERNNQVIDSPPDDLVIFVGDRLVFLGDIHQIAELHDIEDLSSVADPHFKLDTRSSHFSEIVIPTTSLLVGKTLRRTNFRSRYGASVVAVYRQGWRVLGNIRDVKLEGGDTLMLLSGEPLEADNYAKDFYFIRHHEKLLAFHPWRAAFVALVMAVMIISAVLGISIMVASVAAVFVLLATRFISIREAQNSVMWNIILLIACSFAMGKAMESTGVAAYFAQIILGIFGTEPHMLIGGIILVTMFCTELMSNNATALILFPVAITMARLAGYDSIESIQTIGVSVAIGASSAYALPTGYQTHMIVYGPGGYKFTDFTKIGVFMNVIIWIISTSLIPYIWPLYRT
jgi:di/tricarboxylate transporter